MTSLQTQSSNGHPVSEYSPAAENIGGEGWEELESITWQGRTGKEIRAALKAEDYAGIVKLLSENDLFAGKRADRQRRDYLKSLQSCVALIPLHAEGLKSALEILLQAELTGRETLSHKNLKTFRRLMADQLALDLAVPPVGFTVPGNAPQLILELGLFLIGNVHLKSKDWLRWYLRINSYAQSISEADAPLNSDRHTSLERVLILAEARLLLGLLLPHQKHAGRLLRAGRRSYADELDAVTDLDGLPHCSLIPNLTVWLGSFVRGQHLAGPTGKPLLKKSAQARWESLVQTLASFTTAQGTCPLGGSSPEQWSEILSLALPARTRKAVPLWVEQTRQALGHPLKKAASSGRKRTSLKTDLTAAAQSDWAHLANLRSNWYCGSDQICLNSGQGTVELLISALGLPVFSGKWATSIRVAGEAITLNDEWNTLCWYNEEEGDFIELRNQAGPVTLDRQIYLSRNDHLAILADTISCEENTPLEMTWSLPLAEKWKARKDSATRAFQLKQQRHVVNCVPLSLPSTPVEQAAGTFSVHSDELHFQQTGQHRFSQILLLEWSPARAGQPADWNPLTITEARQVLSPETAFASRCRIGDGQWLYLRNLDYNGQPRAVLGLHTDAETIIGEFPSSGEVEKLVEVQFEEDDE